MVLNEMHIGANQITAPIWCARSEKAWSRASSDCAKLAHPDRHKTKTIMAKQTIIDDLASNIGQLFTQLPDPIAQTPKLKALLNAALNNLDVVSREEFDAQTAVLAKTRKKIDALEQQLEELVAQQQNQ